MTTVSELANKYTAEAKISRAELAKRIRKSNSKLKKLSWYSVLHYLRGGKENSETKEIILDYLNSNHPVPERVSNYVTRALYRIYCAEGGTMQELSEVFGVEPGRVDKYVTNFRKNGTVGVEIKDSLEQLVVESAGDNLRDLVIMHIVIPAIAESEERFRALFPQLTEKIKEEYGRLSAVFDEKRIEKVKQELAKPKRVDAGLTIALQQVCTAYGFTPTMTSRETGTSLNAIRNYVYPSLRTRTAPVEVKDFLENKIIELARKNLDQLVMRHIINPKVIGSKEEFREQLPRLTEHIEREYSSLDVVFSEQKRKSVSMQEPKRVGVELAIPLYQACLSYRCFGTHMAAETKASPNTVRYYVWHRHINNTAPEWFFIYLQRKLISLAGNDLPKIIVRYVMDAEWSQDDFNRRYPILAGAIDRKFAEELSYNLAVYKAKSSISDADKRTMFMDTLNFLETQNGRLPHDQTIQNRISIESILLKSVKDCNLREAYLSTIFGYHDRMHRQRAAV